MTQESPNKCAKRGKNAPLPPSRKKSKWSNRLARRRFAPGSVGLAAREASEFETLCLSRHGAAKCLGYSLIPLGGASRWTLLGLKATRNSAPAREPTSVACNRRS